MPNIDKIRVIDEIQGTTQDYGLGVTASQDDIELPIDYNTVYDINEHQIGWYAVTGGYKPVYRKAFDFTVTAKGSTDISYSENIDIPLKVYGYFTRNDESGRVQPFPFIQLNQNPTPQMIESYYYFDQPNSKFVLINSLENKTITGQMILEYTKTTDEIVEEIPQQTIPSYVRTYLDTVPVGTELDYDGQTVPEGYEEVEVEEEKEVYSTDEVKTNKVWIDGKPIYRKVFTFTTIATSGVSVVNIPNFDNLVELSGTYKIDNDNQMPPNFYVGTANYVRTWTSKYNLQDDSINLYYACAGYVGYTGRIILEYTKTTDQGGNE